jgi:hypothetical protein
MKNNILLTLPLALLLLLCVGLASAAITLTNTASDTTFFGSGNQIRFTVNDTGGGYGAASVTSCNASLTSSLTTNSTDRWTVNTNGSVTVNVNMTWVINISSAQYQDSKDYLVKVNCSNSTASFFQGTLLTTSTVDNTVPTAATITSPDNDNYYRLNSTVTVEATITDANTNDVYVVWRDSSPNGFTASAMNCSSALGSTCTLALTNVPNGGYYYTIRTSDGTNNTYTSYQTFTVDRVKMTGAAKTIIYSNPEGAPSKGIPTWLIVVALLAVAYYFFIHKKKRK